MEANPTTSQANPTIVHQPPPRKTRPWRCPPLHPALLKFKFLRTMSDDELKGMADSYQAIGLLFPIVVFIDNESEARGEKGPFPKYLLAGRNRFEMLKRIGIEDPREAKIASGNLYGAIQEVYAIRQQGYLRLADGSEAKNWVVETDPELYVLATDVHRRQLNGEEMREAIRAYIERDSQRAIARSVGFLESVIIQSLTFAKNAFQMRKTRKWNIGRLNARS